jgi:hypothetical protein
VVAGKTVWTSWDLSAAAAYSSIVAADIEGVRTYLTFTESAGVGVRASNGALMFRYPRAANGDLRYAGRRSLEMRHSLLGLVATSAVIGAQLLAGAQITVDVHRTVYVTATDRDGEHVTDLTAADLKIEEDGREREILDVVPSTAPLKIALAVDELLAPYRVVREAVWRFVQRLSQHGDMALYLVGRRNEKQVEYTRDVAPFWNAINAFPLRPRSQGALVESLHEIAQEQRSQEGRRVIVALAPEMAQVSNIRAEAVLDDLRETGAVLHTVTIMSTFDAAPVLEESPMTRLEGGDLTQQVERDRVLGNGPRQSGGLRLSFMDAEAFPIALDRIATALLNEYIVTYVMPAGTESDGDVRIESRRQGVSVRGPRRLPEL